MSSPFDLVIVMPVYNEEGCIARVLGIWLTVLSSLPVRFRILVINDGSRDNTAAALRPFESDPRIRVLHKANSGHGPTILAGYQAAVQSAAWVFQCDSDDEIPPGEFIRFWEIRESYDVLFGVRVPRIQTWDRWIVTRLSRLFVGLFFAFGVPDANVPFRLFRRDALARFLPLLPPNTFSPNLALAGASLLAGLRIANIPVPFSARKTGKTSLANWTLWVGSIRSFFQTWALSRLFRAHFRRPD